jgi:hypothetical protein
VKVVVTVAVLAWFGAGAVWLRGFRSRRRQLYLQVLLRLLWEADAV